MKVLNNIHFGACLVLVCACNQGIDPISPVDPGTDETPPEVTITYPGEGALIRVKEDIATINIQFAVTDDIEIESIAVLLDGTQIASFNEFKDYRRALTSHQYNTLTNGTHKLTITAADLSGKTSSKSVNFEKVAPYQPRYAGEIFYMPFDGDYLELISITSATEVGDPGFATEAVEGGRSYAGATDGYLTFPTGTLLGSQFSATFWYKINAVPDRSGILTIGPPDLANPAAPNNRKNGFRFFREGGATNQTFKLNVGNGTSDSWYDGGANASINPVTKTGWIHIAFTISGTQCAVYLDGTVVSQGNFSGVDWTGCDILSIASGAPRFLEWGHKSDLSNFDELRLFNKALTAAEVQAIMSDQ